MRQVPPGHSFDAVDVFKGTVNDLRPVELWHQAVDQG
jgi:hypothetical protein